MVESEIARIRRQIDLACEAAQRGMNGYAITARHEFINKRLQDLSLQLDVCKEVLEPLVGTNQAIAIIFESYEKHIGNGDDDVRSDRAL